jgi:hypothetical protein
MTNPYNPLAYPVVLRTPDWLPANTPADGRLPLARLVVAMLEPGQVVELRLASQCLGVELNNPGIRHGRCGQAGGVYRISKASRGPVWGLLAPGAG